MTWFTALTACPEPIGPTWVIVLPRAARIGRARSTSAASPPTKIVNVAFWAPSLPPDTGASTRAMSRFASSLAKPRVAPGEIVEQSMTSVPGLAPAATPSGPSRTAATSGVSDTQMTSVSTERATSAGVAARSTPRLSSSGARSGVRFHAVTANPARARFAAIAAPIVPRPMNPTRSTIASVSRRRSPGGGSYRGSAARQPQDQPVVGRAVRPPGLVKGP